MPDQQLELKDENSNIFAQIQNLIWHQHGIELFPDFVMELLNSLDSTQIQQAEEYLFEIYKVRYEIFLRISRYINKQEDISLAEQDEMLATLRMLNNFRGFVEAHKSEFDHESEDIRSKKQGDVYESTWLFLEKNGNLGYIDSPTGSGKTNMMVNLALETGLSTVIVAPTNEILEQTYYRIVEIAKKKGRKPYIRVINKDRKDPPLEKLPNREEFDQEITLITYTSFVIDSDKPEGQKRISANSAKLILLDEAHESLTNKRFKARDQFKDSIRIGFTGTAFAVNNENYGELIHKIGVQEAIQEGMLASVKTMLISINYDTDDWVLQDGDYKPEDIEKFIKETRLFDIHVETYKNKFSDEEGGLKQGIIFFNTIEQAEEQAKRFNDNGIKSFALHSKLSDEDRKRIDEDFKRGAFPILTAVKSIGTGWDYPGLQVVINALPSTSAERIGQQSGRGLRLNEKEPNKVAIIVDILIGDRKLRQVIFADILGDPELRRNKESVTLPKNGVPEEESRKVDDAAELTSFPGVRVISDIKELIEILNTRRRGIENTDIPGDWMTRSDLVNDIGKGGNYFYRSKSNGTRVLKEVMDEFMQQGKPEHTYVRIFRQEAYYSPEFITALRKKLDAFKDWVSLSAIATSFRKADDFFTTNNKTGYQILEEVLADYQTSGVPKDTYSSIIGGATKYSPDFIEALKNKLGVTMAPEDWVSLRTIATSLKKNTHYFNIGSWGYIIFNEVLDEYQRRGVPKDTYSRIIGGITKYSPEFIESLLKKLNDNKDWVSLPELAISLDLKSSYFYAGYAGYQILEEVLADYQTSGVPKDTYSSIIGAGTKYSPEFIQTLENKLNAIKDWVPLSTLAKSLKKGEHYFNINHGGYIIFKEVLDDYQRRGLSGDSYSKTVGSKTKYSPDFIESLLRKLNQES